jgi:hypothetical protein
MFENPQSPWLVCFVEGQFCYLGIMILARILVLLQLANPTNCHAEDDELITISPFWWWLYHYTSGFRNLGGNTRILLLAALHGISFLRLKSVVEKIPHMQNRVLSTGPENYPSVSLSIRPISERSFWQYSNRFVLARHILPCLLVCCKTRFQSRGLYSAQNRMTEWLVVTFKKAIVSWGIIRSLA